MWKSTSFCLLQTWLLNISLHVLVLWRKGKKNSRSIPGSCALQTSLSLFTPRFCSSKLQSPFFCSSLSSSYGIYPITSSVLTALFHVSSHFLIAFFLLEIRSLKWDFSLLKTLIHSPGRRSAQKLSFLKSHWCTLISSTTHKAVLGLMKIYMQLS